MFVRESAHARLDSPECNARRKTRGTGTENRKIKGNTLCTVLNFSRKLSVNRRRISLPILITKDILNYWKVFIFGFNRKPATWSSSILLAFLITANRIM